MIRFARIIETTGHQLLIEQYYHPTACNCGKLNCVGRADLPALRVSTWSMVNGKEGYLFMITTVPTATRGRKMLEAMTTAHAAEFIDTLQQCAFELISKEEAKAEYDRIINSIANTVTI